MGVKYFWANTCDAIIRDTNFFPATIAAKNHYLCRNLILQFFTRVYEDCRSKAEPNDMMRRMIEEVLSR